VVFLQLYSINYLPKNIDHPVIGAILDFISKDIISFETTESPNYWLFCEIGSILLPDMELNIDEDEDENE
jgi:hypothetical protein